MRVYYIFLIRNDIYEITKDKPDALYKLFESMYYLKKDNSSLVYSLFKKIACPIDRKNINKRIIDLESDNLSYSCYNYKHNINDFLNNEITKLEILNSHIVIKSNTLYPTFFKVLSSIDNLFVCDFYNEDYFYLKDVASKTYSMI